MEDDRFGCAVVQRRAAGVGKNYVAGGNFDGRAFEDVRRLGPGRNLPEADVLLALLEKLNDLDIFRYLEECGPG